MVRPERVHLQPHDGRRGDNLLPAMVERTVYLGATIHVDVHLAGGATLQASVPNTGDAARYRAGQPVVAYLPPDAIRVLGVDGPPSNPAPVGSVVEVAA
jgi:hypothetical protein